jgi:hypothetical protein
MGNETVEAPLEPWAISEDGYPASTDARERLRFLLGYAVLAPSGHNTQPWLFRMRDQAVELYADRTRALPVVDPPPGSSSRANGVEPIRVRNSVTWRASSKRCV